jgi:hypothetical protein
MVPDPSDSPPERPFDPVEHYEVTYRATRAALWDVLGTATLALFLVVAGLLGFYMLAGAGVTLAGEDGTAAHAAVAGLGAVMLAAAAYRLYGLYRG